MSSITTPETSENASGIVVVEATSYPDRTYRNISYVKRPDGWYVATPGSAFRLFAVPEARERDLRQLILKEFDVRY